MRHGLLWVRSAAPIRGHSLRSAEIPDLRESGGGIFPNHVRSRAAVEIVLDIGLETRYLVAADITECQIRRTE